jgi:hypothetical protein
MTESDKFIQELIKNQELAKKLFQQLQEEAKKPMVDNGGNNQVKGGESTSSGDANVRR